MVGSKKGGSSVRKSARLENKRRKVPLEESEGSKLNSRLQTDSKAEEDLVVVNQEEESSAGPSEVPDPNEWGFKGELGRPLQNSSGTSTAPEQK